MKFSKKQLTILVAFFVFIACMSVGISKTIASPNIENQAKDSIATFFNSYLDGNYYNSIDSSNDARNNSDREKRYEQLAKSKGTAQELKNYEILSVEKYNDNLVGVTVKLTLKKGTVIEKYPVIKENNKWVLDITHAIDVTNRPNMKLEGK